MNGKLEFGCDYLQIMRALEFQHDTEGKFDPVADAAARLFLLQWGFSLQEIDDANKLFYDRAQSQKLENDLGVVAKRIVDHIRNDRPAQERLVMELAAVGAMDRNVNENEVSFVQVFQNMLDMKSSEFFALCNQGQAWAHAL
ncbi:MAG: hypothetical protein AAB393_08295, partial [Bacteroidota bacterium]